MKKLSFLLILAVLSACTSQYDNLLRDASRASQAGDETAFFATIEDQAVPDTKVYANQMQDTSYYF